jgi:hypothetical protein
MPGGAETTATSVRHCEAIPSRFLSRFEHRYQGGVGARDLRRAVDRTADAMDYCAE